MNKQGELENFLGKYINWNHVANTTLHNFVWFSMVGINQKNIVNKKGLTISLEMESIFNPRGNTELHKLARLSLINENKNSNILKLPRFIESVEKYISDVNTPNNYGQTPFHLFCGVCNYKFYKPLLELLLDKGADVMLEDQEGNTPLHYVADSFGLLTNTEGVVLANLLLDKGADVNAKNNDGNTPAHLVAIPGCKPLLLSVLSQKKADFNIKNNEGKVVIELFQSFEDAKTFPVDVIKRYIVAVKLVRDNTDKKFLNDRFSDENILSFCETINKKKSALKKVETTAEKNYESMYN